MHCGEYKELTAAHVDGVLTLEEKAIVTAHLASCQTCTLLVERERRFAQSLRGRNLIRPTPIEVQELSAMSRADLEKLLAGYV